MANAVWPSALPQRVLAPGYDEQPPELTLRTPMDAGPAKVRRRFTAGPRPIRASVRLSMAQRQALDDFFVTVLAGGALPFDWSHPVTSASATFRFRSPPRITARTATLFDAALDLEILP